MSNAIRPFFLVVVLLSALSHSAAQEEKPCKVECDGSLRAAVEAYATAIVTLDADAAKEAYDLTTLDGIAVGEVVALRIEFAKASRDFEAEIQRKFGDEGLQLLRQYLQWRPTSRKTQDIQHIMKEEVKIYVGEDGVSALVQMGSASLQEYTPMKFARGKWRIAATKEEASGMQQVKFVLSRQLDSLTKGLFKHVDQINSLEELETRLRKLDSSARPSGPRT